MKKKYLTLRIIRPSGREVQELLFPNTLRDLRAEGHDIRIQDYPQNTSTPWVSGNLQDRIEELIHAVEEEDTQAVLCAKGGYGASDLLPHLPWEKWQHIPPKILVGFSDATALLSAFYEKLGWSGIHGPMPATSLWTSQAWQRLKDILLETQIHSEMALRPYNHHDDAPRDGNILGGCLSVLSCMIGTPWMPNLRKSFLFLEDINENPGQVIRNWNQLVQSGATNELQGLILGDFAGTQLDFRPSITQNLDIPVWETSYIGHHRENRPVPFGRSGTIQDHTLTWSWT